MNDHQISVNQGFIHTGANTDYLTLQLLVCVCIYCTYINVEFLTVLHQKKSAMRENK